MNLGPDDLLLKWTEAEGAFFGDCDYLPSRDNPAASVSRCSDGWRWDAGLDAEGHAATKEEAMAAAEAAMAGQVHKVVEEEIGPGGRPSGGRRPWTEEEIAQGLHLPDPLEDEAFIRLGGRVP
jgi:hypothetical protein